MLILKFKASRGALALASIAVPILAAEIILRLMYSKSMNLGMEMAKYSSLLKAWSHGEIGHVHKPGKKAYLMGHHMTINGLGMRDLK